MSRARLLVCLGLLAAIPFASCARGRARSLLPSDAPTAEANPYRPGPFGAETRRISWGTAGVLATLKVFRPQRQGTWPLVQVQHGFAATHDGYDEVLLHLASHGFVVVAPQMYGSGLQALWSTPKTSVEADVAVRVLAWCRAHLAETVGVGVDASRVGLVGHSRGGKIVWMLVREDPTRAQAIVGLDPVDTRGGWLRGESQDEATAFAWRGPTLIVGAGVGGGCAPRGRNHELFFEKSPPGTRYVVVPGMGHADMMDHTSARRAAWLCGGGSDRAASRRLVAGLLVAHLRDALHGDLGLRRYLESAEGAPRPFEVRRK